MEKYRILRPPLHSNFELPTREELLGISLGQRIKIIFQADDETPERMWVEITDRDNDSEWSGLLDNDPVGKKLQTRIKAGEKVSFHPLDIIQIYDEGLNE